MIKIGLFKWESKVYAYFKKNVPVIFLKTPVSNFILFRNNTINTIK